MSDTQRQRERQAVRTFMQDRGLNLHDWQKRAGVADGTLRNWFSDPSRDLSRRTLQKLADAERVSIAELLGHAESEVLVDPFLSGEPPSGFQRNAGYRFAAWSEGRAELLMPVRPRHLNRAGVVHGGVYMSLIDTACGFAGCHCPHPGRRRVAVSLTLATSFVGQCSGGTLLVVGQARGGGRRIFVATAEVFDADGRLLALGEGSYRYRRGSESPEGVPV